MAKKCEMIIGFLVPHRCDNPALGHCTRCGLGFCETHMAVTPEGLVCHACQQGLQQPVLQTLTTPLPGLGDAVMFDTFTRMSQEDESDEMFSDLS